MASHRSSELWEQDPKKYTQAKVAAILGVARETVRDWFGTNCGTANTSPPYARVKVPVEARPKLVERLETETVSQVAPDYGISERQVKNIHTKERKQAAAKARKAVVGDDMGIVKGDFRKLFDRVADKTCFLGHLLRCLN
jgi:hypothetical protein